ncbi:MAG: DUF2029 domain-containing protein [Chloroflexi bacterium]|nr:DUF2029 domain-containing protein [Chloroflexota bacterium]
MLLTPLTLLPYNTAVDAWAVCSFALLCIAMYALVRSTGASVSVAQLLLLVTGASLMSSVRTDLFAGNANAFLAACLCAAIWLRQARRPGLAGVLLALAGVTKPMLLGIVVFLLWKREFKFALSSLATFVLLLLVPFLWIGERPFVDMVTVWQFWSSHFLSFQGNIAPRGVLERTFNINPYVQPIVVAPAFATVIWLAIVAGVFIVTLALVAPRPIQRDGRTLLEFGLIISAFLVMSPLTETIYLAFLIIPFAASFMFLRASNVRGWQLVAASSPLLFVWLFEVLPRGNVESFFPPQSPSRAYVLIAAFLQQAYLLSYAAGVKPHQAVANLVRNCPQLALDWLRDFGSATMVRRISPAASSTES